jgi:hypothetical protein
MCSEELFPPSSQRYPNIQDLQISYSNTGSDALINILRCFPYLKSLYYENGGASIGYDDFLPQRFGRAISHLHETLEELTVLDRENNLYGDVLGLEEQGPIGSLAEFKKLKTIVTYYDLLLKPNPYQDGEKPKLINILPYSLEMLTMAQSTRDILPEVRDPLDRKSSSTQSSPNLKKIMIGFVSPGPGNSSVLAEQLEAMKEEGKELAADGEAIGIEIRILDPNYWIGGIEGDYDRYPLWR